MNTQKLHIDQLNNRMKPFESLRNVTNPESGWVKSIRRSFGMSLEQLGTKLGITKQSVRSLEQRESKGSITLRSLEEAAEALDMTLVYGFLPKDQGLDQLIERKARRLATEIVMRTSWTMKLEGQENSKERIENAINERTIELINQLPKALWA